MLCCVPSLDPWRRSVKTGMGRPFSFRRCSASRATNATGGLVATDYIVLYVVGEWSAYLCRIHMRIETRMPYEYTSPWTEDHGCANPAESKADSPIIAYLVVKFRGARASRPSFLSPPSSFRQTSHTQPKQKYLTSPYYPLIWGHCLVFPWR